MGEITITSSMQSLRKLHHILTSLTKEVMDSPLSSADRLIILAPARELKNRIETQLAQEVIVNWSGA